MGKKSTASKASSRKVGRSTRKSLRRGNPISLFVRDVISAEQYFKLTKQS